MWSVQDLLDYMATPAYKAAVEASRREKEKAEDDYFDRLGEIVEHHPVGRPISRFAPLARNLVLSARQDACLKIGKRPSRT